MGFDSFVILAGMRTGSNLLEAHLNAVPGIACHGELFNPHFVGYPNRDTQLGLTLAEREADPARLLQAMKGQNGVLPGFRFFRDHDARALDIALGDPRCAKILLTRNPVDSFISLQIARQTGQWKLTDARHRRQAKIRFEPTDFDTYLAAEQAFVSAIKRTLQHSGQTGFALGYDDLADADVLRGLVRFLGVALPPKGTQVALKRQNPEPARDKVTNPKEMEQALAKLDWAGLGHVPLLEPERGPAVRRYVAGAVAPLLYIPLPGGPDARVEGWLAALDAVAPDALRRGFNQKTLRQWRRQHPGHRSFTVISHPLVRAHRAFCRYILPTGPKSFPEIRAALRERYGVPIPATEPGAGYGPAQHREAFLGFLHFLQSNLSGQTSIRVARHWASQNVLLQGVGNLALPDLVIREEDLSRDLAHLAGQIGAGDAAVPDIAETGPVPLSNIHDDEVEAAARAAYQRDYMMFGYRAWR